MVVQHAPAPLPVAPAVGALSLAVAGGVRGQGLGIPWPLLGCPCRLRGRLNILESSICLGCGGSAVAVDVPAGAVHHRLCPCAHVETLFCLQFLDLVDMPVIVHCQVRSHCGMLSTPLSWCRGRFLWSFPEFLVLQPIDKVVVVSCTGSFVGDSRVPTVAASFLDKVVDMPVAFDDYTLWFNVQKTAVVPQLLRVVMVAEVPVVQVVLVPLSAAMDAL